MPDDNAATTRWVLRHSPGKSGSFLFIQRREGTTPAHGSWRQALPGPDQNLVMAEDTRYRTREGVDPTRFPAMRDAREQFGDLGPASPLGGACWYEACRGPEDPSWEQDRELLDHDLRDPWAEK